MSERAALVARFPAAFAPNWSARVQTIGVVGGAVGLYIFGLVTLDFDPSRIMRGFARLGDIFEMMLPPTPDSWSRGQLYFEALIQTLSIAFLGTLMAAILAVPLGFLAARNIVANWLLHILARRGLDTMRSVDTLIWALIWINVVGLGPFAGALAIMTADIAAFGKLMSEAIETADRKPVEGVAAAGGNRLEAIRFGIIPQILPIFASQVLYFFESNTRSATIIGIVGAGGIGLYLSEEIRVLEWQRAAFLILMVLVTVAIIDQISQRLRAAIMGNRGR
ncbi:MAG: phosphonate ABC transporter, permease protein PhnE [Acetobacteraceae bacterium]|nr:phosphonate ABC transporter, permease protein PhnE [Acetobacteraceae bacterium]